MKGKPTFMAVDHRPPQSYGAAGGAHVSVDMSPVTEAIKALRDDLKAMSLKVDLSVPEPHIVEITPAVHLPTPEPVVVNLPAMAPIIEVKPADVVFQQSNGAPVPAPVIEINVPWWAVFGLGAVPILSVVIEMILRHI